ncbi:MAG TPA: glycogen synthase [Chlamydiales bacterium]|nr:glycogen synthase [Chlamydiales bacterium]
MKIIHLSTEFAPIAKAGGLGDVLVGLVRRLTELGQDVSVMIPKYDFLPPLNLKEVSTFQCFEHGVSYTNKIWSTEVENCRLLLLEVNHPKNYFNRPQIYGEPDDIARFLYFTKACLEYLKNQPPQILHIHDWHTAAAALLAKDLFHLNSRIVLTIHNSEYQGRCASWDLDAIGLKGHDYIHKLQDDQYPEAINLLKGGIVYADVVNTVSPTYAHEILTPELGGAMSATYRKFKDKLYGILNGIDQTIWNPALDKNLSVTYSAREKANEIAKHKELIRNDLEKRLHLGNNQRPWIGAITRLVHQKNPELLEETLYQTLQQGGTFLLLGSSPVPAIQHHFERLKEKYSNNNNVFLCFEYNEALAHELYAALDFLVMPSNFEPCGLSQLIAMRYGTIPIVRKTGGLKDTVFDLEDETIPPQHRNGFVFERATKADLTNTIFRATQLFHKKPTDFQELARRIMQQDFGWEKPTQKYLSLYDSGLKES